MAISSAVAHHRAKVARRKQSYPDGHPKVVEAQQDLAYEGLAEHAARVVADWPTPPPDVLDRIAGILRGGVGPQRDRQAVVAERISELDGGGDHAA